MKLCFILGGLLLLMGGCSLTTSVLVQDRLARVPRMTCDQLVLNGAPADGQVMLTDLRPCGRGYVATRIDGDLDLYIPAYGAGLAQEPAPADLALLLQVWSDEDRHRLLDQRGPVEATCWANRGAQVVEFCRGPGEVEHWARDGLVQRYPGIKLANVWVLTFGHGSTPTADRVQSAWRYGIGELFVGTAVMICGSVLAWRRLNSPEMPT